LVTPGVPMASDIMLC